MINITRENLCWLAGLLEGEGCFNWSKAGSPLISIAMTDLDVIEKVRDLIHPTAQIYSVQKNDKCKVIYRFKTYGINSIEWMKLLYPLMGLRRREKITEIINLWENKKPLGLGGKMTRNMQNNAIKAVAISKNISYEEAKSFLLSTLVESEEKK